MITADLSFLKGLVEVDKWLTIYLILTLIDFTTGLLKGYHEGFKSRKLRDGIIRVCGELVSIIFAGVLDITLSIEILLISTKLLFCFKQALSIIENLGILGIELPEIIKERIEDLNPNKKEK